MIKQKVKLFQLPSGEVDIDRIIDQGWMVKDVAMATSISSSIYVTILFEKEEATVPNPPVPEI